MAIEGVVERMNECFVGGWCFDRDDPKQILRVQLELAGQPIETIHAAKYRPDLANCGIGGGDHGFKFQLRTTLSQTDLTNLVVRALHPDGREVILSRLDPVDGAVEPAPAIQHGIVDRRIQRCILHIGMEKTGTTSLQRYLAVNRDRLHQNGILVPRTIAPHASKLVLNHISLMTYALDISNRTESLRAQLGCIDTIQIRAHRAIVVAALANEIHAEGKNCDTLLLSNEHCQSRLVLHEEICRLRNFLLSFCETVQVVLYLRSQIAVATSSYGTILKEGAVSSDILPTSARKAYDYDSLVARWEAVFGSEKIDVRIYPKDLVGDFFSQLQIDLSGFVPPEGRENSSFDEVASRVLAKLNRPLALIGSPDNPRIRSLLLQALEATHAGRGLIPSRKEAEAFQRRFEESNERLRRRRFPDRTRLFDDDFSSYGELSASKDPSLDEMAAVMVDVLRYAAR